MKILFQHNISKGSWEKTEKTEVFFGEMAHYIGEPYRIGWTMERVPILSE